MGPRVGPRVRADGGEGEGEAEDGGEGETEAEGGAALCGAFRCLIVSPTSHPKYSRSRSAASPASWVRALTLYESFTCARKQRRRVHSVHSACIARA